MRRVSNPTPRVTAANEKFKRNHSAHSSALRPKKQKTGVRWDLKGRSTTSGSVARKGVGVGGWGRRTRGRKR